jgi:pimeloyl-ACP methyl ester carboxylesterase
VPPPAAPGVEGVVLVSPVVGGGPPAPVRLLARLPGADVAGPTLLRALGPRAARLAMRRWWHERPDEATVAGHLELFHDGWERPLWAMTRHQSAVHAGIDLATVAVPPWGVAGNRDRIAAPAAVAALVAGLPRARLVPLDGCGHLPQEERPDALAGLIEGFVADLERGPERRRDAGDGP